MANRAYEQGMEPLLFHPEGDAGTSDLEEFILQEESPLIPTTVEQHNEELSHPFELQSNIQSNIEDGIFEWTSQEDQTWRFGHVPQDSVLATSIQDNSGLPVYQGAFRSQYWQQNTQQQPIEPAENLGHWQKENDDAPAPGNFAPNSSAEQPPCEENLQIDIVNQTEQQLDPQQTSGLEYIEPLFREAETASVPEQHMRNGAFVDDENSLKMLKNGKDIVNLPHDLDGLSDLLALDLPDLIQSYLADNVATDGGDDILREERTYTEHTELKDCDQPAVTANLSLSVVPGSLKRARDEDKAFAEDCPSAKAKKNETSELNVPNMNFGDTNNESATVPADPQPNGYLAANENWPVEDLQQNLVPMQPPRSTNNRVEAYPCDEAASQQVPYAVEDIPPMAMTNPNPLYVSPDSSTQIQQSGTESDSALLMDGSLVDTNRGIPLDFLQQFLADLPDTAPFAAPQNPAEQPLTQPHQSTPNDSEYPTIDLTIDNDDLEISPPVISDQQATNTAFPFPLSHPLQTERLTMPARREIAINGQNVSYVQTPPEQLRKKALPNRPATLPRGQTGNRPALMKSGNVRKDLNVPPTAQEKKQRGELEDRVKSFSSSFKFGLQYHRMVKPLANSGFKLIRQDRMKCMDARCLMQHMTSALEKDARDITWHLPDCRFVTVKKPCKHCVSNGDCRGCEKCA